MIAFLVDAIADLLTAFGIATGRRRGFRWGRGTREEEAKERAQAEREDRRAGNRWR